MYVLVTYIALVTNIPPTRPSSPKFVRWLPELTTLDGHILHPILTTRLCVLPPSISHVGEG